MKEKELRELDAWIASNIFMFYVHHEGEVPYISHFKKPDWDKRAKCLPEYTTDPAAAMAVLEKCAAMDTLVITNSTFAEHPWVVVGRKTFHRSCQPTLPLAICLFAKQLFKK